MVGIEYDISNIGVACPLDFEEECHIYTHRSNGVEYTSASRFLGGFKEPFDKKGISAAVARSEGRSQEDVLKEWDKKNKDSIDHGNHIHKNLEDYNEKGNCDDKSIIPIARHINTEIIGPYYRSFNEVIFWLDQYHICGTADRPILRTGKPNPILDIYDYKTNLAKGIYYNSSVLKNGKPKHYKKFLLEPISHLEDCNYNFYALQLSLYAYMAQAVYGVMIGQLGIIFVYWDDKLKEYKAQLIPVPYLKYEIEAMLKYHSGLKRIPKAREKKILFKENDW